MPTDEEMMETIKNLADVCAGLKANADDAKKKYDMAKSELEMLCEEYGMDDITTGTHTVNISHRKKFSRYKNVKKVLWMIPISMDKEKYMSLDRKKINGLIKEGVLPKDIQKLERYSEYNAVTIKPLEE